MCGQHYVRASAEDNIGQNTDKRHTSNPRTEIKIPDTAGNRTRAAGLEGRDSTDYATATDNFLTISNYMILIFFEIMFQISGNFLLWYNF